MLKSVVLCILVLVVTRKCSSLSVNLQKSQDANITDYESLEQARDDDVQEDEEVEDDGEEEEGSELNEAEDRNCSCSGSNCVCCINLNLSFIDLGGPGCVKFNYLQNDSLSVNISYGERLLESNLVSRQNPESTCMDLLSDLAQMCAKFTSLSRVSRGVKGCVTLEPLLLGVSQAKYDVGCFDMDHEGVQPQISHNILSSSSNDNKNSTEKPEEEEEELAAAISQSAEEGLAWFNNFITSVFGEELNETSSESSPENVTKHTTS